MRVKQKKPRKIFSAGIGKRMFVDLNGECHSLTNALLSAVIEVNFIRAGRSVFAHSGGQGVQIILAVNARNCVQDGFVLDAPGPRSAYFIPALHSASTLTDDHAASAVANSARDAHTSVIDYGGWVLEPLTCTERAGASPLKARDLRKYKHGHPSIGETSSHLQDSTSIYRSLQVGDSVLTSLPGDTASSIHTTLIGYMDSTGTLFETDTQVSVLSVIAGCQYYWA